MKKKVLVIAIIAFLTIGAAVAGAMVATYISQIDSHKESEKNRLSSFYEREIQNGKNQMNGDLQQHTQQEKQRITSELDAYVTQKVEEDLGEYEDDSRQAITEAADNAIVELKAYVDALEDR